MSKNQNNTVLLLSGISIAIILGTSSLGITNTSFYSAFALRETQPNIKASDIYQTHTMVLGKNIQNLVIELPNEGHEDPTQPKELRVVNQPYLPQNAVINVGTTVTWFNADAGHKHQITLVNNNSQNKVCI